MGICGDESGIGALDERGRGLTSTLRTCLLHLVNRREQSGSHAMTDLYRDDHQITQVQRANDIQWHTFRPQH